MLRPLIASLLVAVAAPALAQTAAPADGPSRTFTPQDIFGLQVASDPQISPDGSNLYVAAGGRTPLTGAIAVFSRRP